MGHGHFNIKIKMTSQNWLGNTFCTSAALNTNINHVHQMAAQQEVQLWYKIVGNKRHTYILSKFPIENWQETSMVKKFHEATPTTRNNRYLLKQDGKIGYDTTNTSVDSDAKCNVLFCLGIEDQPANLCDSYRFERVLTVKESAED